MAQSGAQRDPRALSERAPTAWPGDPQAQAAICSSSNSHSHDSAYM